MTIEHETEWSDRGGQCLYLARWLAKPPDEELRRIEAEQALLMCLGGDAQDGASPADIPPLEELQVEHAALFAAPGPRFVSACESVYRDKFTIDFTGCGLAGPSKGMPVEGLLWGPTTPRVLETYRAQGWDLPDRCAHPPDHIALELEFYGRLLVRVESDPAAADRAREFFLAHLDAWAPTFFRKVAETPGLVFLQRLGLAGLRWCDAERGAWAAVPVESSAGRS